MTPAPTSPARTDALFARAYRATGYGRVGFSPVAATATPAGMTQLVLPLENIVAVDVRCRPATSASVSAAGPDAAADVARRCADRLLAENDLRSEVRLTVRPMAGRHPHVLEAAAVAAVNAVCRAEELPLSSAARAQVVRSVVPDAVGLTFGAPAVVTNGTQVVHIAHEAARLRLVTAAPDKPTFQPTFGQLVPPPTDLSDERAVARWLVQCSGHGDSPALAATRAALAGIQTLGVVGGHGPGAPLAVLLPGDPSALVTAQRVSLALTSALAGMPADAAHGRWRVTTARAAAHSAIA